MAWGPGVKEAFHHEACSQAAVHPVTGFQVPLHPEQFDNAVATYGMQLRSWIELQVEACLSKLLQGVDGEIIALRQEVLSVMGVCEHMDSQVLALSESQVEMDRRLEVVLEESAKIKGALASCHDNVHAMLENHGSNWAMHVAELRKKHDQQAGHISDFQHRHREYVDAFQRHSSDISEVHDRLHGLRGDLENHVNAVEQLERTFTLRHEEVSSGHVEQFRLFEETHQKDFNNAREKLLALEQQLSAFSVESNARLQTLAPHDHVQRQLDESRCHLNKRIDELQACLLEDVKTRVTTQDLVSMQQKLLARMRAEMTAAFRSEAEAVTALDDQFLFKEQLLRQRLDKAENLKARERIAVIERGGSNEDFSSDAIPAEGSTVLACYGEDHTVGSRSAHNGSLNSAEHAFAMKSDGSAVAMDEKLRNGAPNGVQLYSEQYLKALQPERLRERAVLLQRVLGPEGRATY